MAFTAKFISKHLVNGQPKVVVEFSDGVTSVEEWCIPSNIEGFNAWVKSRLEVFNSDSALDSTLTVGAPIDTSTPVVTPHTQTQAELDEISWRERLAKLKWVKENLIDTGILTGSEAQVVTLRNGLKTDFKASYIA
jgi:hypothetical protein